ncbi:MULTISPECIES: TIGR00341 family protein [Psychrobacter]|uniref:Putative hydrophobic protein (TIGR00341 family) n=1 Tax=Psychrobacter fozii TaxID=198480 RepID=A0A2V4VLC0_9GAMM|nr:MULTISPECIES: TIGR00341 family protein [Psychrobacter]MBH0064260.1 TIGR00341 family protein [Psychrobacter sp. SZ93C1]PYE39655.1 putative hydrophobic protein (TIGR00341 family) [Psychrobacter fozii]
MTSSEEKSSNNTSATKDSLAMTKPEKEHAIVANETDNSEPDITAKNAESSEYLEHHDENESDKDMADTQNPDAKVIIESISPDVAVATLETPDTTTSESDTSDDKSQPSPEDLTSETEIDSNSTDFESANLANSEATKRIQDDDDSTKQASQEEADAEVTVSDSDIEDRSLKNNTNTEQLVNESTNAIANKPETGTKQDGQKNIEDTVKDEANDQEAQEEEVKEQKEAKLESYKQFVAEQFSNQKVDYPEVRVRIEANALPSKMYFIMNILSAIIASYGLVTNSAAVVIGAMLVAMMLGPITGVALAIIDHRMPLLRRSLITMLIGVSLVILVGFIVGWLHKDQPLTAEILSRTQPTSMDLMIALAGGTAGAYAMVSPHLSVAVVGVAVATALVPPLAASGILLANGELQLGLGAFLLAITNIIAIQFTNALVLWLLGFRRLVDDDYKSNTYLTFLRRNAVTLLLLGGLGTYLTINLQTNAKQQVFESSVKETINSYFIDKGNVLTNTQFETVDDNQVVRAVIRGETTPSSYDVRQIELAITQDMATNFPKYLPIKLQLRYLPVQVIESNPLIQDRLDETDAAILTN